MVRPSQARKIAAEPKATGSGDEQTDLEAAAAEFGDHSSTYWPTGWNFERFSKASSLDVLQNIPEGDFIKLQAGMREALGEAGRKRLSDYLLRLALKRTADAQSSTTTSTTDTAQTKPEIIPPDWLRQWTRRHRDQTWGFVAMQTACYDEVNLWNDFKTQFQKIVEVPFERDIDYNSSTTVAADASAAKAKFEIRWIEDPALDGQINPDVLRQRYKDMRSSLPIGLSQPVFLVASKDAIASVLNIANDKTAEEDTAPPMTSERWRPGAPYTLAVAAEADPELEEGHEEREWFKPVFKVAVEVLVDEFWHVLDSDIMPLRKTTRSVKGVELDGQITTTGDGDSGLEDIWWTMAPSPQRLRKRRRIE